MFNFLKQKKAFTLVEMGITIVVIGILTAMAMIQTQGIDESTENAMLEDYLQKLNRDDVLASGFHIYS